jgi:prokaryotic YEATS domain
MTPGNEQVLFYVILGFFVLIGLSSLLVLLGYIPSADRSFRKWAVPGFVGAVTSAVLVAYKIGFHHEPAPIVVTLRTAEGTIFPKLKSGEYKYDEVGSDRVSLVTQKGGVVPVVGEGGWQVTLPGEVSNKVIQLILRDEDGNGWETPPFYPNYVRQEVRAGKTAASAPAPAPISRWEVPGVAVLHAADAIAPTVRINNYARRIGDQYERPYYEWRVFVDESPAVLERIASVDYALHPTFADPFQSSRDRRKQFELRASGWGSFTIMVTIHYTDGRQTKFGYWLDLKKPWPAPKSTALQRFQPFRIGVLDVERVERVAA